MCDTEWWHYHEPLSVNSECCNTEPSNPTGAKSLISLRITNLRLAPSKAFELPSTPRTMDMMQQLAAANHTTHEGYTPLLGLCKISPSITISAQQIESCFWASDLHGPCRVPQQADTMQSVTFNAGCVISVRPSLSIMQVDCEGIRGQHVHAKDRVRTLW